MTDEQKSKEQLLEEIKELREQVARFERLEKSSKIATERLLMEKTLSEEMLNHLPGVFYLINDQMKLSRWNDPLERVTGYSTEEIARMDSIDFFEEKDRDRIIDAIQTGFAKGKTTLEANLLAKNRTKIPYFFSGSRIKVDEEFYLVGLGIDITKRRRLEEIFRDLVNHAPMGIFIVKNRKLKMVNPGFQRITGYSEEELLESDCLDLATPEYKNKIKQAAVEILKGQSSTPYEYQFLTKDGQVKWAMESVTTTSFDGGKATLGYFMDITERKLLEENLTRAQRIEAIGILAGGVAHDFNNLLTAILGYSELMKMDLDSKDPYYQYVDEILKTAQRGSTLTHQLLAFSRKQVLQPSIVSINALVLNMERLLKRLIGEDIELVTAVSNDLGAVRADKGQMEQVIMNLAVNARDAMPQGGKLTLETANVYLDADYGRTHVSVIPGHYVMLAISDTGVGMDAKTRAHIFEPFFTTKELGSGTGLGLATVYGIIKQSGGNIWVYSEPGKGTTFKIYLPRVKEAAVLADAQPPAVTGLSGRETILVVEDDETLRQLIDRGLRKYGYNVLKAANGGEALLLCEKEEGPVHLLLTDVVMPQMNGRELAERLALLCPAMKILFMSGYTEAAAFNNGVLEAKAQFLQKPFKVNRLVRKIREVLESKQ